MTQTKRRTATPKRRPGLVAILECDACRDAMAIEGPPAYLAAVQRGWQRIHQDPEGCRLATRLEEATP